MHAYKSQPWPGSAAVALRLPMTASVCARHGLMLQILRVVPYSATQLYSYEVLKKRFQNENGELSLSARLAAGGLAGMTATLVSLPSSAHTFS